MQKIILISILIFNYVSAANVVLDDSSKSDIFKVAYYYDETKLKTIDDIQKIQFLQEQSSQFSLGYLKGNSWFKFSIENRSDTQDLVINFAEAFYDILNFYEFKDNRWIKYKDGLYTKQNQKELKGENPAFLVNLKKGDTATYYIEASTSLPTFAKIEVFKFLDFVVHKKNTTSLYMFYFGGLFIIVILNLFLYVTLKDIIYAYYVGYTVFYIMFVFILTGFNNVIGLENYYYEFHVSPPFLMLFLVLFTSRLLEVKTYSKFYYKLLNILSISLIVMCVLVLTDVQKWYPVLTVLSTIVFISLVITTLYIGLKGNSTAKVYFIALSLYLVCMVLFTSMANGWIENSDINRYLFLYASFFEIIFFSLILANRFNKINQEKMAIQEKLIDTLKSEKEKEKLLRQQSKLAQMGEMISMIAHQWRQPLGAISSAVFSIKTKIVSNRYDLSIKNQREEFLEFLNKKHISINEYVQFLSTTIDDFRGFYKPDKQKEIVSINEPIKKALQIVQKSMKSKGISFTIDYSVDNDIALYKNEMIQVILNILKNSEDNFKEKSIKNGKIKIVTKKEDTDYIISICDNGGGIDENILLNIFDPYFSTKNEKNGTGLGLYMSKIIVEEHNCGKLEVKNKEDGVCFIIRLNKKFNG